MASSITANRRYKKVYHIDPVAPRGLCVVIDVLDLSKGDEVGNIQRTFASQNFIVKVHTNLTSGQIGELVEQYARIDHSNFYCFCCVILAPANRNGELCGADCTAIDAKCFINTYCQVETLKNKPKVFFIQKNAGTHNTRGRNQTPENAAIRFSAGDIGEDVMVCSYCIDLNLPQEQTTFFREYETVTIKRGGIEPLYFILDEARTNYELQLEVTSSTSEFNFCCYDTFKYDFLLPLNGEEVQAEQANNVPDLKSACYPLICPIRGYCLIINNLGTEFQPDCEKMEEVFGNQFGFHTEVFDNLSAAAIKELLVAFRSLDHSYHDALVVTCFAKLEESLEKIEGVDGKLIAFDDIEDNFTYENCLTLSSKPKIFMYGLKDFVKKIHVVSNSAVSLNVGDDSVTINSQYESFISRSSSLPDNFRFMFNACEVNRKQERFSFSIADALTTAVNGNNVTLDSITKSCGSGCFSKPTTCRQLMLNINRKEFNSGEMLAAKLQMVYAVWLKIRSLTIKNIRQDREKLVKVVRDVRISRVVGASTGIVGGVIAVVGLGLTPVTLGTSLAISGVGVGIAVLGGVTGIGATMAGKAIQKSGLKEISELLVIDQQISKIMQKNIEEMKKEADRLMTLNSNVSKPEVMFGMLRAGEALLRIEANKGISISGLASNTVVGSEVNFTVGMGSIFGGALLEVILLPLSVIDLAISAHGLAKQKNTDALKEINELIRTLENNLYAIKKYMTGANEVEEGQEVGEDGCLCIEERRESTNEEEEGQEGGDGGRDIEERSGESINEEEEEREGGDGDHDIEERSGKSINEEEEGQEGEDGGRGFEERRESINEEEEEEGGNGGRDIEERRESINEEEEGQEGEDGGRGFEETISEDLNLTSHDLHIN